MHVLTSSYLSLVREMFLKDAKYPFILCVRYVTMVMLVLRVATPRNAIHCHQQSQAHNWLIIQMALSLVSPANISKNVKLPYKDLVPKTANLLPVT